jgi:very-short-patch-repair endonuclease
MKISSITSKGTWCPYCVRKTEKKMLDFLQQHYTTIHQFRQEWCKNSETGNRLPFDFCIPELDIIIELDGLQHFIQVMNWRAPDIQQNLDYYKQVQANNNGYSVIRILQPDVYYDRYDWMTELKEIIERIRYSDTVENFYMCKNGEYAHF